MNLALLFEKNRISFSLVLLLLVMLTSFGCNHNVVEGGCCVVRSGAGTDECDDTQVDEDLTDPTCNPCQGDACDECETPECDSCQEASKCDGVCCSPGYSCVEEEVPAPEGASLNFTPIDGVDAAAVEAALAGGDLGPDALAMAAAAAPKKYCKKDVPCEAGDCTPACGADETCGGSRKGQGENCACVPKACDGGGCPAPGCPPPGSPDLLNCVGVVGHCSCAGAKCAASDCVADCGSGTCNGNKPNCACGCKNGSMPIGSENSFQCCPVGAVACPGGCCPSGKKCNGVKPNGLPYCADCPGGRACGNVCYDANELCCNGTVYPKSLLNDGWQCCPAIAATETQRPYFAEWCHVGEMFGNPPRARECRDCYETQL